MPTDYMAEYRKQRDERKKQAAEEAVAVVKALKAAGHKDSIRMEFSGSGDSGDVNHFGGIDKNTPLGKRVYDWMSQFSNTLPDWWNNEGGSGWIEIDPTKKEKCVSYASYQNQSVETESSTGAF